jgi:hypothetical protein
MVFGQMGQPTQPTLKIGATPLRAKGRTSQSYQEQVEADALAGQVQPGV